MKQKFENCFVISNIKNAIWYLECANKLKPNTIDEATIIELKLLLADLKEQKESGDKSA
jgi:hypothetical protein